MPNFATLASLRTRVRQAADIVSGQAQQFITDSEVNGYVNDSFSELHDLLVLRFKDYARTITTLPLVSGQEFYSLPEDFYKVAAFWFVVGGVRQYQMPEFMTRELPRYQNTVVMLSTNQTLSYRIADNQVMIAPIPSISTGGTVELWYIPQFKKLYNDSDQIEVAVVNGWEEYIVVDAAIKCTDRMGRFEASGRLEQRKARLEQRIIAAAADRDAGTPQRVTDTGRRY